MNRPSRYDRAQPDLLTTLNKRLNMVLCWEMLAVVGVFSFIAWMFWTMVVNW